MLYGMSLPEWVSIVSPFVSVTALIYTIRLGRETRRLRQPVLTLDLRITEGPMTNDFTLSFTLRNSGGNPATNISCVAEMRLDVEESPARRKACQRSPHLQVRKQ